MKKRQSVPDKAQLKRQLRALCREVGLSVTMDGIITHNGQRPPSGFKEEAKPYGRSYRPARKIPKRKGR